MPICIVRRGSIRTDRRAPLPQYVVYNAILRKYPRSMYEAFSAANNRFNTTIFVLASAVSKVPLARRFRPVRRESISAY